MKFLLDENVRADLDILLQRENIDFTRAAKGTSDRDILRQSMAKQRIIVTNDSDFTSTTAQEAFGVIWLRVPQHDANSLLDAFKRLLAECHEYAGKVIVLQHNQWSVANLSA